MAEEGNYFNLIIFLFHCQIPEIFSITPNVVSLYGTNHAVLLGHNLGDVSGVRIQMHTDCAPKEWVTLQITKMIPGLERIY